MEEKDEHLVLSSGIGFAGLAVSNFWDYSSEAFFTSKTKLLQVLLNQIKFDIEKVGFKKYKSITWDFGDNFLNA